MLLKVIHSLIVPAYHMGKWLPRWLGGKESAVQETPEMQVQSLGWKDLLEEGMATHSSALAWRVPWTEEPAELQSDRVTQSHTESDTAELTHT